MDRDGAQLVLVTEDGRRLDPVDEVIVLTGFRPDLSFLSEVRLGLDERLQAPTALAPLIDPDVHSCGTVYPHGVNELSHPEQGVYLVGMKSYGRAPTFLAMEATASELSPSSPSPAAWPRDLRRRSGAKAPTPTTTGDIGTPAVLITEPARPPTI